MADYEKESNLAFAYVILIGVEWFDISSFRGSFNDNVDKKSWEGEPKMPIFVPV